MTATNKYVKRPVEVEAVLWSEDKAPQVLIDFTNHLVRINDVAQEFYVYDRLHDTWVQFQYGDWIIKGVKGEFYPCEGSVFDETYVSADRLEKSKPAKRKPVLPESNDPENPPKGPGSGGVQVRFDPYPQSRHLTDLAVARALHDPYRQRS